MNERTKKIAAHTTTAVLTATVLSLFPHKVKYQLPKESTVVVRDANGTDGSDESKVDVVTKIPKGDGTFTIQRVKANKIKLPEKGAE